MMRVYATRHMRRGGVLVPVAISMTVMMGLAALTVDIGRLYVAQTELQISADAAALAGAMELLDDGRLAGEAGMDELVYSARVQAAAYAELNDVAGEAPAIDLNEANCVDGDIVVGYLPDLSDQTAGMDFADTTLFNSVLVRVRRTAEQNGSIGMVFAGVFGYESWDLGGSATAGFQDGIDGYSIPADSEQTAMLLPFALHEDYYVALIDAVATSSNDNYAYDPDTGVVSAGPDGIPEINFYPGAGSGQLPPGNFGTVDIGSENNSTADISRQILEGVNADDLSYFGGELRLDGGTIELNGDTGVSAAVKDELEAIKGQPRSIPLFTAVSGPGDNAYYTVNGFGGVRIMNVKLTGPMSHKNVIVQPAVVTDSTAIADADGHSHHIYSPVVLCR